MLSYPGNYLIARAKYLLPINPDINVETRIEDGYIVCEKDKIIEVGQFTEEIGRQLLNKFANPYILGSPDNKTIPQLDACLLPSFVIAHGHDDESCIIGTAKDVPLTVWLDEAVNVFAGMMNERREELTELFGKSPNLVAYLKARIDNIYYGATSCCVHFCNHNKYYVPDIVTANEMAGTKMIVAVGSQDRHHDPRILDTPAEVIKRLDKWIELSQEAEHTWIIPGPDQLFSNGPDMLKVQKEWANKHNTLVHCHSSEEPNTTRWFKETYGQTPVEYAYENGFLDSNTVLAHQVNSTDHDLELIKKTGTKIVHNPLANTILGDGVPDIPKMMKMGIPIAISTDGSGSADNQNILAAARAASQYQRGIYADPSILPAIQCLEMITRIPASFYGLNCGSLKSGMDADFVLIDTSRPNLIPSHIDNIAENLIWASDGSEVQYVVANGVILKDDYEFSTLNKEEILKDVKMLAEQLREYKKTAVKITGTGAHKQ
eukprot:TRINITY_DN2333_c0_g1_i1.p1 TRINITY_DN2333_c0_g1~~TRINITY_DN2333_c0_g1_i1.p1  ORF type:complete len:490 (+),score=116.08 TRINITY_DN2333_c0_g1_i1:76-1545(+)